MTTADYMLTLAPAWVWWTGYGAGCALAIVGFGAMSRDSYSSGSDDFGLFSFLLCVLGWPFIVLLLAPLLAIGGLYHFGHWLAGKPWKRQRQPHQSTGAEPQRGSANRGRASQTSIKEQET